MSSAGAGAHAHETGSGAGWMPSLGLGTTLTQLGRAAKDITSTLETGLQNVAENLEGAFVTIGETTADRAGCVTRTTSYSSDRDQDQTRSPRHSPSSGSAPPAFEGSERERFFESGSQSGSGPMGCGSSYDHRSTDPPPVTTPPSAAINCDMCGNKFSFISRKRTCGECGNVFCTTCLPNERNVSSKSRTCARCGVLNKRPPHRGELMKLRVKDLQHFLTRKRINIKSCVEKKDLVELVLQHSQASTPIDSSDSGISPENPSSSPPTSRLPSSGSWNDNGIRVSDQVPLERNRNFPQNYVESSHRREWFQEKFGDEDKDKDDAEEVTETPVETMDIAEAEEVTTVEPMTDNNDSEDEVMSVVVDHDENNVNEICDDDEEEPSSEQLESDDDKEDIVEPEPDGESEVRVETEDAEEVQGAVGGQIDATETTKLSSDPKPIGAKMNFDHLSENIGGASLPSSPRRFANHGLVYLSEIETLEDLNELSTKQIKDLLAMNRVNFKGCVEKDELLKILQRLWKQEQRNKANVDTMDDEALCKICMDKPIDCVMLECGHMCTCTDCGKQMAECPICRQYVVRVVKTFKA